jgi:hypothetical protein
MVRTTLLQVRTLIARAVLVVRFAGRGFADGNSRRATFETPPGKWIA